MRGAGPRTALVLVALTILVSIVAFAGSEPIGETEAPPPVPQAQQQLPDVPDPVPDVEPPPAEQPEPEQEPASSSGTPDWLRWLGLLLLAVAAALVARAVRRRLRDGGRRRPRRPRVPSAVEEEPEPEEDVARRAIDAALVPLREPVDAREAVIEAYVRMERVLAERALERQAPEAPREYLDRVLREQGMPERSLTALTELFEEARFSRHPVPDEAPAHARAELEHAREVLGVSATP